MCLCVFLVSLYLTDILMLDFLSWKCNTIVTRKFYIGRSFLNSLKSVLSLVPECCGQEAKNRDANLMYPKLPFSFTTTYIPQDTNYNYNNTHQMELYHHCLGGSAAPPLTQLLLKAAVKMEALVAVSQVLAKGCTRMTPLHLHSNPMM